jgi:hypothetical protein
LTGAALALVVVIAGCAPQRPYRPAPPSRSGPVLPPAPEPPPPPPPTAVNKKPLAEESKIREQDLQSRAAPSPLPPGPNEPLVPPTRAESGIVPERSLIPALPLPDDSSLLAKITPATLPQRAASLRLADEGNKLLEAGDTAKALSRLERSIVVDSTNPYGYFYLAKAQHRLGRHRESLNFLGVAELRLRGEPFWLAEVHALRGEIYRALGQLQSAETSYAEAIRLNSGNRTAAEALLRLHSDAPPTAK